MKIIVSNLNSVTPRVSLTEGENLCLDVYTTDAQNTKIIYDMLDFYGDDYIIKLIKDSK